MRLFAGLGNPGSNYAMNRHNVGFLAVDRLADRHGCSPWKKKGPSLISDGRIGSEKIILVKPQSFMNKSGLPIAEIARFHKIDTNDIFVFHVSHQMDFIDDSYLTDFLVLTFHHPLLIECLYSIFLACAFLGCQ